jgi:hypothetical protein
VGVGVGWGQGGRGVMGEAEYPAFRLPHTRSGAEVRGWAAQEDVGT